MTAHSADQTSTTVGDRKTYSVNPEPTDGSKVGERARLMAAALVLGALFVVAHTTGIIERFDADGIRVLVLDAGSWGVAVFLLAFAIGPLLQLPGIVFVAAAVLIYGQVGGGLLAWVGGVVAVATTFCTVRFVGGQPKAPSTEGRVGRLINKLIAGLQRRPLRTVIVLRTLTFLSPPINYALALSPVRYRDYMLGSAVGLIVPMAVVVGVSGCVLQ